MDLLLVVFALVPLEWVLCLFSIIFTLAHTTEEVIGDGGPFWSYYARHFGHGIDDILGVVLFVDLGAALILLAIFGYLCGSPSLLGVLIGARLGDAILSHICLRLDLPGPNPGLQTAPLYLIEFAVVALTMPVSALGFGIGLTVFMLFWTVSIVVRKR